MQITFQTDYFKPMAGEESETNAGRYGKALALWLATKLKERGVSIEGVIAEDFGWIVLVARKPFLLWIGCGSTDGSISEWSVFPIAEVGTIQRIFRRINPTAEIERLMAHLVDLVPSVPGVSNVVCE